MLIRYSLFILGIGLLLASATASAQKAPLGPVAPEIQADVPARSHTQKLFVKFHRNGIGLSLDQSDAESGGGFGLKLGYGVSRLVTLYFGIDGASMERGDYSYGMADLGARFNLGSPRSALIPYADVALTGQSVVVEGSGSNVVMSGGGLTFGGGLQYFVSPLLALDVGLTLTPGAFDTVRYQGQSGDVDYSSMGARFMLGLSWFPIR